MAEPHIPLKAPSSLFGQPTLRAFISLHSLLTAPLVHFLVHAQKKAMQVVRAEQEKLRRDIESMPRSRCAVRGASSGIRSSRPNRCNSPRAFTSSLPLSGLPAHSSQPSLCTCVRAVYSCRAAAVQPSARHRPRRRRSHRARQRRAGWLRTAATAAAVPTSVQAATAPQTSAAHWSWCARAYAGARAPALCGGMSRCQSCRLCSVHVAGPRAACVSASNRVSRGVAALCVVGVASG